jgi:hypothetical protein
MKAVVRNVSTPPAAMFVFEGAKQGVCRPDLAQSSRDEIEPFARVEGVAVERDRRGVAVHGLPVTPEAADEPRGLRISSKQIHETFVTDYGFTAVT